MTQAASYCTLSRQTRAILGDIRIGHIDKPIDEIGLNRGDTDAEEN